MATSSRARGLLHLSVITATTAILLTCSNWARADVITLQPEVPGQAYLTGGALQWNLSYNAMNIPAMLGGTIYSNDPIYVPPVVSGTDDSPKAITSQLVSAQGSPGLDNGLMSLALSGFQGSSQGLTLNVPAPTTKFGVLATGGTLTISNIDLDTTSDTITGTVSGSNGVGTHDNVALWQYGQLDTTSTAGDWLPGADYQVYNLTATASGLNMTADLRGYLAQALGMRPSFLGLITNDFGTLTAYASIASPMGATVTVTVPEPTAWALMGLGLVGLNLARSRRSCARSA